MGYPTKENAEKLGVPFRTLKKFIWDGMLVDKNYLIKKATKIQSALKGAKYVHLTDEFGTDLTIKILGRKPLICDGYISDEDVKCKEVGSNLPDGEVFIPPVETYGHGVLASPKRTDRFTGKMIEDIHLFFKDGRIDMNKTSAEKNEAALKSTLKKSLAIDKKVYKKPNATSVAELGIGLNPVIDEIIGYLLTDEKIGGTIHIAVGSNDWFGGKSQSSLHWDFISNDRINIDVIYPNGREKRLMEKGKLVTN